MRPIKAWVNVSPALIVSGPISSTTGPRKARRTLGRTTLGSQQPVQKSNALLSDGLNNDLPKWLSFSGEVRGRFEGFAGGKFQSYNNDFYFLERVRLNLKIQPADWFKFVFQGQDAHALGKDNVPASSPYQDAMDLRLGYLELGDAERKPVSFRAGRQELVFGDERLIGSAAA